jgi:diguanylate cyclase (GGDEF)-like protein
MIGPGVAVQCLEVRRDRTSPRTTSWPSGDEFVIGLPDADAEGAAAVAEAVRAAVCARPLTIVGRQLSRTVSVGWATWEDDDLGQLLARADGALYEAKAAGRDCVRPRADSPT